MVQDLLKDKLDQAFPADPGGGIFVGRIWIPEEAGPSPVVAIDGKLYDFSNKPGKYDWDKVIELMDNNVGAIMRNILIAPPTPAQYVALKTPAQPHSLSLSFFKWGAVSVPKKNFAFPLMAASTRASLWVSLFRIGRQ